MRVTVDQAGHHRHVAQVNDFSAVNHGAAVAHFAYAVFVDDDADVGAHGVRRAIEQARGIDDLDACGLWRLRRSLRQLAEEENREQDESHKRPVHG
jgi:hypothetical protein